MASGEGQTMSIGEAASLLGVSVKTVRRWADTGKLKVERSPSGHRRFLSSEINQMVAQQPRPSLPVEERITINYARVSSHDQKEDLTRQIQVLEHFSGLHGWQYETIKDTGSGLNYQKKGLQKLLKRLMKGDVGRLVLTHKDRLLRFGAELVFAICEEFGTEVVIINQSPAECSRACDSDFESESFPTEEMTFEQELVSDMIELVTVFSARLYGARSRKNKKLIDGISQVVSETQKGK